MEINHGSGSATTVSTWAPLALTNFCMKESPKTFEATPVVAAEEITSHFLPRLRFY